MNFPLKIVVFHSFWYVYQKDQEGIQYLLVNSPSVCQDAHSFESYFVFARGFKGLTQNAQRNPVKSSEFRKVAWQDMASIELMKNLSVSGGVSLLSGIFPFPKN